MFEIQRCVCLRKMPFWSMSALCGNQAREGKGKVVEKPQDARVPFQPQLGVTKVFRRCVSGLGWNHQPGVGIARWWQLKYFLFSPGLGKWSYLTSIFIRWVGNHQLDKTSRNCIPFLLLYWDTCFVANQQNHGNPNLVQSNSKTWGSWPSGILPRGRQADLTNILEIYQLMCWMLLGANVAFQGRYYCCWKKSQTTTWDVIKPCE